MWARRVGGERETNGLISQWFGALLQVDLSQFENLGAIPLTVMAILLGFSLLSFTVIFAKLGGFRRAKSGNEKPKGESDCRSDANPLFVGCRPVEQIPQTER